MMKLVLKFLNLGMEFLGNIRGLIWKISNRRIKQTNASYDMSAQYGRIK